MGAVNGTVYWVLSAVAMVLSSVVSYHLAHPVVLDPEGRLTPIIHIHTDLLGPAGLHYYPDRGHLYSTFAGGHPPEKNRIGHMGKEIPKTKEEEEAEKKRKGKLRWSADVGAAHAAEVEPENLDLTATLRAQFVGDKVTLFNSIHPLRDCPHPGPLARVTNRFDTIMYVVCHEHIKVVHDLAKGLHHHKDVVDLAGPGGGIEDLPSEDIVVTVMAEGKQLTELDAMARGGTTGHLVRVKKGVHDRGERGPAGFAVPTGIAHSHDGSFLLVAEAGTGTIARADPVTLQRTGDFTVEPLPGIPLAVRRKIHMNEHLDVKGTPTNYWVLLRIPEWPWALRSLLPSERLLAIAFGGKSAIAELGADGRVVRYLENHEGHLTHLTDIEDSGLFLHFASAIGDGASHWRYGDKD
jgi:hypothetical protein